MRHSELITASLRSKLDSFYEQNTDEQQSTLALVREVANTNPTEFIQFIHQQEFNGLNDLPFFYQALAADLIHWNDFFIQEAMRLFKVAEAAREPRKVLTHLDEFCFIESSVFKNRDKLIALLCKELGNERAVFRFYAASLLPDFLKKNDFLALDKYRQLLSDSNWRIRYLVYLDLRDLQLLTESDRLSLLDRVRAYFFNFTDIN